MDSLYASDPVLLIPEESLTEYSMLGSLTIYRRLLHENVFTERNFRTLLPTAIRPSDKNIQEYSKKLPAAGHGLAGMWAGWTVSMIAAPVEHVKARLQVQYSADKSKRLYSGPIDCVTKIVCFPP